MENKFSTVTASEQHLPDVVRIHCESLPDDFLPGLGADFLLRTFYPAVHRSNQAQLAVVMDESGQVTGFIITTRDSGKFLSEIIKKNVSAFLAVGIRSSLRSWKSFRKNIEILYASLFSTGKVVDAGEIYIIAVDERMRGRGVGKLLVTAGETYLRDAGMPAIKIKTLASNADWIHHFEKSGWELVDRFSLIGNAYVVLKHDL